MAQRPGQTLATVGQLVTEEQLMVTVELQLVMEELQEPLEQPEQPQEPVEHQHSVMEVLVVALLPELRSELGSELCSELGPSQHRLSTQRRPTRQKTSFLAQASPRQASPQPASAGGCLYGFLLRTTTWPKRPGWSTKERRCPTRRTRRYRRHRHRRTIRRLQVHAEPPAGRAASGGRSPASCWPA